MRLTLRTLLAYLDDLLEPKDAEDIGHRVEESEFATSIINRIHDCMRRLRLGVPPLNARGTGGDANTVAEYLDNTMAPDLVPEFERVCLESDVHLAEVAASHQILTLVLGEPAEIDPASRQRMYRLFYDPEGNTSAAKAAAVVAEPPKRGSRRRPQVPEYLRDSDGAGWWSIGAMLAAAVILIGAGLYLFWPREPQREVAQALQGQQPLAQLPNEEAQPDAAPPAEGDATDAAPADGTGATDTPPPDGTAAIGAAGNEVNAIDPAAGTPTTDTVAPPVTNEAAEAAMPADEGSPVDAGEMENDAASKLVEATPTNPLDSAPDTAAPAAGTSGADAAAPDAPAGSDAANASHLGRYVSEGQVLLRHAAPDDWFRIPPREPLMIGDRVVSLPNFRGTVALSSGVTAQILGATEIELQAGEQNVPELTVYFGRLVLMSSGQPNAKVHLKAGDQSATLTLSEASSVAGIEVSPVVETPEVEARGAVLQTLLFVANGAVEWQLGSSGNRQTVAAPAIQTWSGQKPPQVTPEDLPQWLTGEGELSDIDRRAVDFMASNLGSDRSAQLSLTEFANHRRIEVKSLAVRSLGLLDEYEPLVDALGDATQRNAWDAHIQVLKTARARGPETATRLQQAITARRPGVAAQLDRMLAGYTQAELQQGEASKLAANLENQDLAVRVLANWNLEQITGERSRFRPHDPPNLRQPQVRRWKMWADQLVRPAASAPAAPR